MKLRAYQEECIQAILNAYSKGKNQQLIVLPTGSGKTVILWSLLKKIQKKALIIAHTKELIDQLNKTGNTIFQGHNCMVCSIQSTYNHIEDLQRQNFDTLIIDEAHHALAPSYQNLIRNLGFTKHSNKLLLGFTATPNRGDGHSSLEVFPYEAYRLDIDYMIDNQFLCDVKGYRIQTGVNLSNIRICKGDFVNHALVSAINTKQRNGLAFDSYEKLGE
jgi:ATP-dependent helicase IRC3